MTAHEARRLLSPLRSFVPLSTRHVCRQVQSMREWYRPGDQHCEVLREFWELARDAQEFYPSTKPQVHPWVAPEAHLLTNLTAQGEVRVMPPRPNREPWVRSPSRSRSRSRRPANYLVRRTKLIARH